VLRLPDVLTCQAEVLLSVTVQHAKQKCFLFWTVLNKPSRSASNASRSASLLTCAQHAKQKCFSPDCAMQRGPLAQMPESASLLTGAQHARQSASLLTVLKHAKQKCFSPDCAQPCHSRSCLSLLCSTCQAEVLLS